ncbi:hypothetical protein ASE66_24810 [Bosea sp. Root483D1]|nr:hypothetical protein ASE66_24810 [Bosea sp. Root483D1]
MFRCVAATARFSRTFAPRLLLRDGWRRPSGFALCRRLFVKQVLLDYVLKLARAPLDAVDLDLLFLHATRNGLKCSSSVSVG